MFFFHALSGAFQALIGLFRMGTLVKYLPHAVLAGFMNAVAILLAIAQLPALLGMPAGASPAEIMVVPDQMRLGSLAVAGVTLAALSLPGIKATRLPPFIVGLVAGTLAHHALRAGRRTALLTWLGLTIALGALFLYYQAVEYHHAYTELNLTLGSGIYGSTFFMLTGFHGMHVTLGAIMLAVIWLRCLKGHFSKDHHFAFEAVAWYWHFVDVVWLGLFLFVYVL